MWPSWGLASALHDLHAVSLCVRVHTMGLFVPRCACVHVCAPRYVVWVGMLLVGSVVPWTYCTLPVLTNAHALAAQIPLRTSLPCPILRLVSVHQACFYVCSCSVCTWNHLEISWIMMRSLFFAVYTIICFSWMFRADDGTICVHVSCY